MKKLSLHITTFLILIGFSFSGFSQDQNTLKYRGETIEMVENIDQFNWSSFPADAKIDKGYVGWIQFEQTPTQEVQNLFASKDLHLLEYLSAQTYLFYFPKGADISFLKENNVRTIMPIPAEAKYSVDVKSGHYEWWARSGDDLHLTVQYFNTVGELAVVNDLKASGAKITEAFAERGILFLSYPLAQIDQLAQKPYIKYVDLVSPPEEKEDVPGRGLHRANALDTQSSAGRKYTGEGVGVMVRDDGFVGPHIDFEGRITNLTYIRDQSHGDGVAGIMSGAGNLVPSNRGMAAGSEILVVNYTDHFLEYATQNNIANGTIQITNSSYGQGCNLGYNASTETVDEQMVEFPHLLHVFSAGNSGGQNCGYGAGGQWGNITGGHKQGKNVIATANVLFDGSLVNSSSRGPAYDGRIKPDITANGQNQISTNENNSYQTFGGTSGAAPGIAGISAQLYEAYANLNDGALPPAALIKATLLNTANDAGNEGPDFKFGWGIVNGLRAAKLLEDERHLSESITQDETKTHTITIPQGTKQVRFMVYWNDVPASPGAQIALVNDLDLVVKDPANNELLPWVLDHTPSAATLNLPAQPGVDRLNNMEQVLINNPEAGDYEINITGFNVPVGPQEYFIVYEVIEENLNLTYPLGGESFKPYLKEVIHWDAINTTEDFLLEYSLDNGATWETIETVAPTVTFYEWRVPNETTGKALVRVTSGDYSSTSPEPFSIARTPSNVRVTQMCEDSVTLEWAAVDNATSYDLYFLGEKYMEIVGSSSETNITLPITDPEAELWFSVRSANENLGWVSERAKAKLYDSGIYNCTMDISDNRFENSIKLYPNPATSEVQIALPSDQGSGKIAIYNHLGQKLRTLPYNQQSHLSINVADLSRGIYFVNIQSGAQTAIKKLIVK